MRLAGDTLFRLADGQVAPLDDFRGRRCHAVAAIGHPEPFFALLRDAGIQVVPHPLSDHAVPSLRELGLSADEPVLMTEKDAVKCRDGAGFDAWFLRVEARLDPTADRMVSAIKRLCSNGGRRRGGY
jgi:tetraacyldisaccharide 4'-kinase